MEKKTCKNSSCKERKPVDYFSKGSEICKECEESRLIKASLKKTKSIIRRKRSLKREWCEDEYVLH